MKNRITTFRHLSYSNTKTNTDSTARLRYRRFIRMLCFAFSVCLFLFSACGAAPEKSNAGKESAHMVRLAKLKIDAAQLQDYMALLKEEIETSVRTEPGVLTLFAVAEKANPTHITILEIYADSAAYKSHLQTPQFIKYKTGTEKMVQSLELVESIPVIPGMKIK